MLNRCAHALRIELAQRFAQRVQLLLELRRQDAFVERLDLTQPLEHARIVQPGALDALTQLAERRAHLARLLEQLSDFLRRSACRLRITEADAARQALRLPRASGRRPDLARPIQRARRILLPAGAVRECLSALHQVARIGDRPLAHLVERRQAEHVLAAAADLRLGRVVVGPDEVA